MLYTKKFVFTVSLCAMLAANPVLAVTKPVTAAAGAFSGEVGKVGTVYSDWAGRADSGIAGVTYVNNAVDAAGNAAQWAENHAAAAAQSAKSAADSASDAAKVLEKAVLRPDEAVEEEKAVGSETVPVYVKADGKVEAITSYQGKAATAGTADKAIADQNGLQIDKTYEKVGNKVTTLSDTSTDTEYPSAKLVYNELDDKVDKDQGAGKENLAMVTDQKGTVYPGYITSDMIEKHSVSTLEIQGPDESVNVGAGWVLMGSGKGLTYWGKVGSSSLHDGAVTTDKIDNGAVTSEKIAAGMIGDVLVSKSGSAEWGQVDSMGIADGAVTIGKIAERSVMAENMFSSEQTAGVVLMADGNFGAEWGQVGSAGIAAGAVTSAKIAARAVSEDKMFSSGQSGGVVLLADGNNGAEWGQVGSAGIADDAVTTEKIAGTSGTCYTSSGGTICSQESAVLVSDVNGAVSWGLIDGKLIADGAVTSGTIANGAVTNDKIADDAVTLGKIKGYRDSNYEPTTGKLLIGYENSFGWGSIHPAMITSPTGDSLETGLSGLAIVSDGKGDTFWGQVSEYGIEQEAVTTDKIAYNAVTEGKIDNGAVTARTIADGAVTIEKTAGVVGMVPEGSPNATTYSQMWIE